MSESKAGKQAAYPPRLPERPEDRLWPPPTPMPLTPAEDVGRLLKHMLDRLDAIEKRLKNIERVLVERQPPILRERPQKS